MTEAREPLPVCLPCCLPELWILFVPSTAVDRSAPTLMCTLSVSNSVLKQFGVEFVAEHVPSSTFSTSPCPTVETPLSSLLKRLKKNEAVTVIGSGAPYSVANGVQSEIANKTSGSPATFNSNALSSISSDRQADWVCPPADLDLEWPPRISSDVPSQIGDFEKQKQSPVGTSAVGSDDFN
ncbi:hypothetical protein Scep_027948 [Stephania cephalantha]|uniref:Uncharacterized protein n=1 Tax=Stephania cephalantha TaxID=152367 RepID=A0AAP0E8Z9_9MAGN